MNKQDSKTQNAAGSKVEIPDAAGQSAEWLTQNVWGIDLLGPGTPPTLPMAIERLSTLGMETYRISLQGLISEQDAAIRAGEPSPSRLPLCWVALAESVGLTVDLATGTITGGPRNQPLDLVGRIVSKGEL